ncbi:TadE/TadG family type IV pilus assembly protein [Novosphingobium cyanobacteriorum]|uniref:Pilus assembly protein n=1 Tax=Novosphingobium cyanobacteriorum TaxID=3024215 RepID=A0ABT6CEV8_9SPHN|nr:TadE/TadG family type IV pilus assembly protein [Novosphingobium cyanobacteriorum]MDF8331863.1 pilus assembly protein [Novosphingobium cyanobacteriorum]
MRWLTRLVGTLRAAREGAVVIEFALLAPMVVLMGLGAVDVSRIVARQAQLQAAVAEAGQIVLASTPDNDTKINAIKTVIANTTGIPTGSITIITVYRCGVDTTFVSLPGYCPVTGEIGKYLQVSVTDTYAPYWTALGVGKPFTMKIKRQIQLS